MTFCIVRSSAARELELNRQAGLSDTPFWVTKGDDSRRGVRWSKREIAAVSLVPIQPLDLILPLGRIRFPSVTGEAADSS